MSNKIMYLQILMCAHVPYVYQNYHNYEGAYLKKTIYKKVKNICKNEKNCTREKKHCWELQFQARFYIVDF